MGVERLKRSVDYWEQQYNPRIGIQDCERHFDNWRRRAAQARAALHGLTNIPYGGHERERLDLFRSPASRGTLVFLHGGYWRAFGREDFSWIAQPFVQAGITVVVPSYPLCPLADLPEICGSVSRAMEYIVRAVLTPAERQRIVMAGHSAGAHLVAHYMARLPQERRPGCTLDAAVCISGIFDLLPLLHTKLLSEMGWRAAGLHEVSPLYAPAPHRGQLMLAVGGSETREFRRQSERLADAWAERCTKLLDVPGRNHFEVLDALCEPEQPLAREVLALFEHSSGEGQ